MPRSSLGGRGVVVNENIYTLRRRATPREPCNIFFLGGGKIIHLYFLCLLKFVALSKIFVFITAMSRQHTKILFLFQIHELDRLSSRICHACISYLNSWQSFKTRCYAAQRKQKSWLAAQLHRQLGLEEENGGKKEGGNAAAKVGESGNANNATRSPSVLSNGSSAGGLDAYNYYPQYHRKGRNNNLVSRK